MCDHKNKKIHSVHRNCESGLAKLLRMHSTFLDRYQATVALTSSFFSQREAYGKCTTLPLKRTLMPTLLHTLHSVVCGELSYRQRSL